MHSLLAAIALACCATLAQADPPEAPRACKPADGKPAKLANDEHGNPMKLAQCHHWIDRSGEYELWELASDDRVVDGYHLSRSLAAQLFKKQPDGALAQQWIVRDRVEEGEAGAWFSQHLGEFRDLDGDGVLVPILVIRFVADSEKDDEVNNDPYAGRLKLILFHGGVKVAVRAVTGGLDDERHTTATDSYFTLPPAWRRHLQGRLRQWADENVFKSDDGSPEFVPKREHDPKVR